VKIGLARDTWKRLRALQTSHYRKLSIEHQIGFASVEEAHAIERRTHMLLNTKRAESEWFKVSPDEARAAKGTGGMRNALFQALLFLSACTWPTCNCHHTNAPCQAEGFAAERVRVCQQEAKVNTLTRR
jgi:hypothetical protein